MRRDSQEVGLEAAILERKRNSSLAEESGAEDLTRLKQITEDMGLVQSTRSSKLKMQNSKLWSLRCIYI